MESLLSGIYTVDDKKLYRMLSAMADTEGIYVEPSALSGAPGVFNLYMTEAGQQYIEDQRLKGKMQHASHIIWATGGNMVPEAEMNDYYQEGVESSIPAY